MFRASDIFGRNPGAVSTRPTVAAKDGAPEAGSKRPLGPASRTWDPSTGNYVDEELPADIQALMGIQPKRAKTELGVKDEWGADSRKSGGKALGPSAVGARAEAGGGKHRGPSAAEIDLTAPSVEYKGFSKVDLNDKYHEMVDLPVHGKPTYWSGDALFFIYWQGEVQRWSICDATSLFAVRAGQYPGWAYKGDHKPLWQASGWMEAWSGEWREPSLEAIYRSSSENPLQWEDKTMQKAVSTIEFKGFAMKELNTRYFLRPGEQIQGRETFWDNTGVYFIYWQAPMKRWAICDLKCYEAVKEGQCPGWAYRKDANFLANACGWMERRSDEWTGAVIETSVIGACEKGLKVEIWGFNKQELNCKYVEKQDEEVQGRSTFWDPTETYFIYWQKSMSRWGICDRASLKVAQQGLAPGWAYRSDSAHFTRSRGWMEVYGTGDWKKANVSCKVLDGSVRDDGYTMNAVKAEPGAEDEDEGTSSVNASQYAMLIRKIYEKKNPAKLEELGRLLSKYQGREHELYRNICDKYNVNADQFAVEKVLGESTEADGVGVAKAGGVPNLSSSEYAILVQNIYMTHNPKKIRDIGALLQKYRHQEKTLYEEVCKKYGEHPGNIYLKFAGELAQAMAVKAESA